MADPELVRVLAIPRQALFRASDLPSNAIFMAGSHLRDMHDTPGTALETQHHASVVFGIDGHINASGLRSIDFA